MINIYKHKTHITYQIRKRSVNKKGINIVKNTGHKLNLKSLLHYWKFYIRIHKNNWFVIIRTPIFLLEKANCDLIIGHPNYYLWIIW